MTHAISPSGAVPAWTLGDRLTKARLHAELTQQQLADALGISRWTVIRYETGSSEPTRGTQVAWATITGVDFNWLIGSPPPRRRRGHNADIDRYLETCVEQFGRPIEPAA